MEVAVFAGGDPVDARWLDALADDAFVIAADSGLEHVRSLGRQADLLVGDLDSVSDATLADARAAGVEIEVHPTDKDATDLELALRAAHRRRPARVTVLGGAGGRLDHFLGNALLLAHADWAAFDLQAFVGDARVVVVRTSATLTGPVGSLVSLLAPTGVARGVSTSGLRWTLDDAELQPGSTHGVSNELTATTASVSVRDGVLLAVQPHALDHLGGN